MTLSVFRFVSTGHESIPDPCTGGSCRKERSRQEEVTRLRVPKLFVYQSCSRRKPLGLLQMITAEAGAVYEWWPCLMWGWSSAMCITTHSEESAIRLLPHTGAHRCLWLAHVAVIDRGETEYAPPTQKAHLATDGWMATASSGLNSGSVDDEVNVFFCWTAQKPKAHFSGCTFNF